MDFAKIIERIKNLITTPKTEWEIIKNEPETAKEVIMKVALPLIIISAIAAFIGTAFIGIPALREFAMLGIKVSMGLKIKFAIVKGVNAFIIPLSVLLISGITFNELAPYFGSSKNIDKAFRLAVYGYFPSLIIGILINLIPMLFILGLVGLYGIYLLWLGLSVMMEIPEDKKVGYIIVAVLVMIVATGIVTVLLKSIIVTPLMGSIFGL